MPERLSYSSMNLLRACERKYFLTREKDLQSIETTEEAASPKNNTHLDFGTALGIGIQSLLVSEGDLRKAIWDAITKFNYAEETEQKNIKSIIATLMAFHEQWNYDAWEVAAWNGKPAAELGFKIVLDEATGDYYCGYMDIVLRKKGSGIYTLVEVKTTGYKAENIESMYQNSSQAVGYSVVLDSIVGEHNTYEVLYIVCQLKYKSIIPTLHFLPFLKSKKDRLETLLTLQLDYEYLKRLKGIDYWPTRGGSCLSFGRTCFLFGVCTLETMHDLPDKPTRKEEDWDFTFTLPELIERALE